MADNVTMTFFGRIRRFVVLLAIAGALLPGGCDEGQVGPAPITVPEYKQMGGADRTRWPDNRIVQMNLTRVGNAELTGEQRIESLRLVKHLSNQQPGILSEADLADLSTLLREPKTPKQLHRDVLLFLLKENYPDLSPFITGQMGDQAGDPELHAAVMAYLGGNAPPQMLSGVVRSWAREREITGPNEANFRKAVERISQKPWDETLLAELNSRSFDAKGEALQILRARLGIEALRKKLLNLHPETEEMQAVQAFAEQFDYLPTSREELITTTLIYRARRNMLPDASRMSLDWTKSYGYAFDIRDFHLLSRLARDPLRNNLKRTQIVLEIGQALKTRKHVAHLPETAGTDYKENFWLQVDKLTMADLWNLYLLNEMLSRPRVQTSLRLMSDGDLADVRSAWGGLVFYLNGQAEATLYPPDSNTGTDDLVYPPTKRLLLDGRDSLCRFIGHFEQVDNASRAGPTAAELTDASIYDYYGLILTRLDKNSFCAHYYTPEGLVISLGKFPLR
ncbi:MAG: hypothetical protein JW849_10555 [Phycisphaerae bacterium]|nr:hypothetical protein [Phycisphaerae bacterium]